MDELCFRAQEALIAGDVPDDVREHIAACSACDRVRRLSEMLVARSRGHVPVSRIVTPGQELLGYRLDAIVGEGGKLRVRVIRPGGWPRGIDPGARTR